MHHTRLAAWLNDQTDGRGDYGSPRALSLAAGLSQGTVGNIIAAGRGDPDSLIAIGRVLGYTKEEMFVLAGYLDEIPPPTLGPDAREVVEAFQRTNQRGREAILAVARAMRPWSGGRETGPTESP